MTEILCSSVSFCAEAAMCGSNAALGLERNQIEPRLLAASERPRCQAERSWRRAERGTHGSREVCRRTRCVSECSWDTETSPGAIENAVRPVVGEGRGDEGGGRGGGDGSDGGKGEGG